MGQFNKIHTTIIGWSILIQDLRPITQGGEEMVRKNKLLVKEAVIFNLLLHFSLYFETFHLNVFNQNILYIFGFQLNKRLL